MNHYVESYDEPKARAFVACRLGPFDILPANKETLNDMRHVELKHWALPGRRIVLYLKLRDIAEREQFKIEFYWKV